MISRYSSSEEMHMCVFSKTTPEPSGRGSRHLHFLLPVPKYPSRSDRVDLTQASVLTLLSHFSPEALLVSG